MGYKNRWSGDTQHNEHKFLGVHIDNKMNWNKHISMPYNKLQANKHLLRLATNLLDSDSLRALYYAHIYSHLRYGISSWGSMTCVKNLKSLFQMQKQCIQTLYKRPKRSNINELFKQGRLLSIHDIIYLEMTVLGYKITHKLIYLIKMEEKNNMTMKQEAKIHQTYKNTILYNSTKAIYATVYQHI